MMISSAGDRKIRHALKETILFVSGRFTENRREDFKKAARAVQAAKRSVLEFPITLRL